MSSSRLPTPQDVRYHPWDVPIISLMSSSPSPTLSQCFGCCLADVILARYPLSRQLPRFQACQRSMRLFNARSPTRRSSTSAVPYRSSTPSCTHSPSPPTHAQHVSQCSETHIDGLGCQDKEAGRQAVHCYEVGTQHRNRSEMHGALQRSSHYYVC
jgi:hypothetical protein